MENIWNGSLLTSIEVCLRFMINLTWKNNLSVTKFFEKKYEKGLTLTNKEMKKLEEQHITRAKGIEKWSILISPGL